MAGAWMCKTLQVGIQGNYGVEQKHFSPEMYKCRSVIEEVHISSSGANQRPSMMHLTKSVTFQCDISGYYPCLRIQSLQNAYRIKGIPLQSSTKCVTHGPHTH